MFHLKFLTKDTHPNLQEITKATRQYPNRPFIVERSNYNLPLEDIKLLLLKKCKVVIQKSDNFSIKKTEELIDLGKDAVALLPAQFQEGHLVNYLKKGASTVISKNDGFNIFQISNLVKIGKDKTTILGHKFTERQIGNFLKDGASILLKKNDLTPWAISRLLRQGEKRINIHGGDFSESRINRFLDGKAIVTIGKKNKLSRGSIERKIKKYKNQIHIESAKFNDEAWLNKMEGLGAVIV